ncbi:MAG: hypothetical protein WA361_18305, partial [Candidatus Acidiferrales bacterium]
MVYSAPSSMAHAWKLQAEPRYMLQWRRRTAAAQRVENGRRNPPRPSSEPRVDWGYPLLAGGTSGLGQYPAKFTFDIYATPDCTNDFVVFNQAGLAGAAATTAATLTGIFTGTPTAGRTVILTSPEATITLTASATVNTGLNFQTGGPGANGTTRAANLAAAIVRNSAGLGITATSAAAVVTISALTKG